MPRIKIPSKYKNRDGRQYWITLRNTQNNENLIINSIKLRQYLIFAKQSEEYAKESSFFILAFSFDIVFM
jgi:hypothetical protein